MRGVTCFKMAMEGEGIKFINSLSYRLAESFGFEIFDYYSTDADFYDILKSSVDSLPNCELKDHLVENTSRYRDQLKSLLESKFKPVAIPSSSALTKESVSESLKTIKASTSNPNLSKEEICHMYEQLLVSSSSNECISFKEISNEWAEYLVHSCDGESILKAIDFYSQCLLNTQTLIFCLDTFIYLYSHLLTIGATPSTEKILSVVFAVHFLISRPECDSWDICYDNQLSALLSIYIECCLLNSDSKGVGDLSSHLRRTLLTFSSKGVVALSSLLQVNVPNGKEGVVLELIKSVLNWIQFSSFGLRRNVCDSHVYLCYICCLNFAKRLSFESSKHFESKCYLKAPALFSKWLYSVDSSICETLGIKRIWSSEQIQEHLLSDITKEKEELLLCLLSHTDRTTEKNPSSNDFREETREKEEVLNAESNGVFFLDNEGEDIAGVTKEWSNEEERNEEIQEATHAVIPAYMETNDTETSQISEEECPMTDKCSDAIAKEYITRSLLQYRKFLVQRSGSHFSRNFAKALPLP
ncbi:PREDICTED: uncharacterized protein LOC109582840 isoform X2 [Amphimedon queenslandica]|uniref:Uncharacterized protein n=1 Tax=Amphimedon queenslandica TaxID=400682 RepID=A0AAN0J8P0_AMPQE|nr:PREDICTED: uncharacterized protein LOC109582840 isoform X2 [Amphimedon queenslandica]|eukprot:XP_019853390.1 PREDICTED: uncharacterized protein LOC109582840 isoform X2 [Amphimedon queenslandica]